MHPTCCDYTSHGATRITKLGPLADPSCFMPHAVWISQSILRDEKGKIIPQPFSLTTDRRAESKRDPGSVVEKEVAPLLGDKAALQRLADVLPEDVSMLVKSSLASPHSLSGAPFDESMELPASTAPRASRVEVPPPTGTAPPKPPLRSLRADIVGDSAPSEREMSHVTGAEQGGRTLSVTIRNELAKPDRPVPPLLFVDVKLSATVCSLSCAVRRRAFRF